MRWSGRPPGDHPVFVSNNEDAVVAAAHSVDPAEWWDGFGQVLDRIGSRFTRCEPRRNAASLMLGLLTELDRKICWTIAEQRGHASPDRLQHLLSRAVWDQAGVGRDLRDYVVQHLGDPSGILIVDETGHLKKGTDSVGVQPPVHRLPVESRTRRSRCIWRTLRRQGTPSSTVRCTCPSRGPRTRVGADARGGPTMWSSRPSPPWPPG